ncbi:hypothetical protein [Streptomyces sp. NPDC001759]
MSGAQGQDQRSDLEDDQDEDVETSPFVRIKRWCVNSAKFVAAVMGLATAASSIYVGMATYWNEQDEKLAQKLEQSEQFARGVTLFRGTGADGTGIILENRNKERLSDVWVDIEDERIPKGSEPILEALKDKEDRIHLDVVEGCSQTFLDYLTIFTRSKGLTHKISPNDVTVSVMFRDIDGKYWASSPPSEVFSGPYNDSEEPHNPENVKVGDVKAGEKVRTMEEDRCR